MPTLRQRRESVARFPPARRLVTAALRSGRRKAPMYGLVAMDVTEARRRLTSHDPPLSMTAFVVASVARAVAAHPEVHAYRNWRGQLVTHHYVDVATLVEISTPQGPFGLVHVLRDADVRGVADLGAELHRVKHEPSPTTSGRWLQRAAPVGARVPGAMPAMYAVMRRSRAARRRVGTVTVSAVGMFAGGGGYAIAPMTMMSLEVLVGGIEDRDLLDLTIAIDHNVVDGAPAARFGAELRRVMESAIVLGEDQ